MILLIDPVYNPNFQTTITSATKLGPGISCAKFLGSPGTRVQFEQLNVDKNLVARQLYLQAEVMRAVINNPTFNNYRLIVAEGIYNPAINETPTPDSINDYKTTGRAVVYQLINRKGEIDQEKTFDLAVYIKDYIQYDELILDYDTFDPSGKMSAQIVVVLPIANESFDLSFKKKVSTFYNGQLQSLNELTEIKLRV
jgi:hypothetical protein